MSSTVGGLGGEFRTAIRSLPEICTILVYNPVAFLVSEM